MIYNLVCPQFNLKDLWNLTDEIYYEIFQCEYIIMIIWELFSKTKTLSVVQLKKNQSLSKFYLILDRMFHIPVIICGDNLSAFI